MTARQQQVAALSSPRTWRCFLHLLGEVRDGAVFSTYVEVFL